MKGFICLPFAQMGDSLYLSGPSRPVERYARRYGSIRLRGGQEMKGDRGTQLLISVAFALSACGAFALAARAQEVGPEPDAAAPAEVEVDLAPVQMVRFLLSETRIEGRVVFEHESAVKIMRPGGAEIRYDKRYLKDIEHYALPAEKYYELLGDFHAAKIWDFEDDLSDIFRARVAYEKSLASRRTAQVEKKYKNLTETRDQWQKEMLKQHELEESRYRVQTAELEKQLAERKLEALKDIEQTVKEQNVTFERLRNEVGELKDMVRQLQRGLAEMDKELEELEDDVKRTYATRHFFLGLSRSIDLLDDRVDGLERRPPK